MTFRLYQLRFEFLAHQAIYFQAGGPANILRGALGHIFRRVAGEEEYQRFFSPLAAAGPSGLRDRPRPYVFRASHLSDQTVEPGETFHFRLNVFQMQNPPIHQLVESFSLLQKEGLGDSRSRVTLAATPQVSLEEVSLSPSLEPVSKLNIRFVTPIEIKIDSGLLAQPDFAALLARVRDRIGNLRALYGDGPIDIDFKQFLQRAAQVQMVRCQVGELSVKRRSSRTGQTHPLGGFIGEAEYAGELAEFLPYFKAAQWTGVGRQASWGKGELEIKAN